jgi:hypothetical protein
MSIAPHFAPLRETLFYNGEGNEKRQNKRVACPAVSRGF